MLGRIRAFFERLNEPPIGSCEDCGFALPHHHPACPLDSELARDERVRQRLAAYDLAPGNTFSPLTYDSRLVFDRELFEK